MTTPYQICTKCVMDTTDPDIRFDRNGICNHCHRYQEVARALVFSGDEARRRLDTMVGRIRRDGRKKEYDCVVGISGGVDSTYAMLKIKEAGLRPLAVHLDNGWDPELTVKNIQNTVQRLNIDLHTHVLNWQEFRDIQLAFLHASTPDCEIPTDYAIAASLIKASEESGVQYILTGSNARTESHLPRAWSQGHMDWRYIEDVHRQFGGVELKSFPKIDFWRNYRFRITHGFINILNFLDFVKTDAMPVIEKALGWKYYGGKHYESIYTRFYQGYILPRKFGFDKRKSHFSSLICAGEMTREAALQQLSEDPYPAKLQAEDRLYVIKKLGLTADTFDQIMASPPKRFADYPSYARDYPKVAERALRYLSAGYKVLNGTYVVFKS